MNWKQFLKPDIKKIIVTIILILATRPFAESYITTMSVYNPFIVILMYILSCLVISVGNNLRRIGMLLFIISIISVYYLAKDSMFGGWSIFFFSMPLFGISLLILLLSFISQKISVPQKTSLEKKEFNHQYPVLTKIAAWWLILVPIYILILKPFKALEYMFVAFGDCMIAHENSSCYILTLLASSSFFSFYFINFSLGVFLLKRRKRAWWMSITILTLALLSDKIIFLEDLFFLFFLFLSDVPILFFIVPVFLLLVDRKNFFKIAE